ncbi:hypothetical protein psyc5s11_13630 [Clostridium gelidum]|uniref:DUF2975 domain-containing protein n=1 Tax=Clostridium gelidum TaxID=704125 RepID=A0ABM7T0D5_9CLOT|nr:DUF2975 domain-containing protein [Clostridium gelidum]BCZ45296.1 hypothetical protein psyc5s11_13630 [Clostridium gelidum]
MNNKTITSIRTNCNNINYIVKLFLYIFVFIAFSRIVYTIFILTQSGNSLEVLSFKNEFIIRSSNLSFWMGGSISKSLVTSSLDQPFSNVIFAFIITQVTFLVNQSLIILTFYFISKILNNIENNYTPFINENARKIKLVGLLLIAYSIVPNLVAYSLLRIVTQDVVLEINSSLPMIFAASFILLISNIFVYGCELQKDSDETL